MLNYPSYLPPTKAVSIILVEKGPANFRRRTARGPANCGWLVWNSLTERSGPAQILVWGWATCVSLCRTLQHPMRIWRWGFIIEAWRLLRRRNSLGHLTRQEIGQDDKTVILKHRFIPSSTMRLFPTGWLGLVTKDETCSFLLFFFLVESSERHTATDLVNFVYYPTGFVYSNRLHQGF